MRRLLLILAILVPCCYGQILAPILQGVPAVVAPGFCTHSTGSGTLTESCTITGVTAGHGLVAGFITDGTGTGLSITTSKDSVDGTPYHHAGANHAFEVAFVKATTGGSYTITANWSTFPGATFIWVQEYSTMAASSIQGNTAFVDGGSFNPICNGSSLTTGTNNSYTVALSFDSSTGTINSLTPAFVGRSDGVANLFADDFTARNGTAGSTISATWATAGGFWDCVLIEVKP